MTRMSVSSFKSNPHFGYSPGSFCSINKIVSYAKMTGLGYETIKFGPNLFDRITLSDFLTAFSRHVFTVSV